MQKNRLLKSIGVVALAVALILLYQNCSFKRFEPSSLGQEQNGSTVLPPGVSTLPPPPPAPAVGSKITSVGVRYGENKSASQYVTFGQVFAKGHVPSGDSVTARLPTGELTPMQVDGKSTHADGSLRHAIFTLKMPAQREGIEQIVELVRTTQKTNYNPIPWQNVLASGFDTILSVSAGGKTFSISAKDLMQNTTPEFWLKGDYATEWMVSGSLKTVGGEVHPLLHARFQIRTFEGNKSTRVSVVLENTWAYPSNPQELSYVLNLSVGGQAVISNKSVTHFYLSRWRKVFWFGEDPKEFISHDLDYIARTRAIPNLDSSIKSSASAIDSLYSDFMANSDLMEIGNMSQKMGVAGASGWIGAVPNWTGLFLRGQNQKSKDLVIGNSDLAGTWNIHYRDQSTGLPLSLDDHMYASVIGDNKGLVNPKTGKEDTFPACSNCENVVTRGGTASDIVADVSHQPTFSYLPYLLTGDFYHLEEMQFWSVYNLMYFGIGVPNVGAIVNEQVRGQGWGIRNLAQTAYLTPDSHPMKKYFEGKILANLSYYKNRYLDNPSANKLGANVDGCCAMAFNNVTGNWGEGTGLAPWMQSFFTYGIGSVAELGYAEALPVFHYFARFTVQTMVDPGFCWLYASSYAMNVRATGTSQVLYNSFADVYRASVPANIVSLTCDSPAMAAVRGAQVGEMEGYASEASGYPSNLQPTLALAKELGSPNGAVAWDKFASRPIQPIDGLNAMPNYGVVPR